MATALPIFSLYGEHSKPLGPDWLHCESIAARSGLHDWEIRPHRHESLFQILHIARGRAEVLMDGASVAAAGPCIVSVRSMSAHGFRFSQDVDGTVLTVVEPHLVTLLGNEPALRDGVVATRIVSLPRASARQVGDAMQAVRDEYRGTAPWRSMAVDLALLQLIVLLGRHLPARDATAGAGGERALAHVQRFRSIVEQRYREQPGVAQCAADIGITPTQLNRVCHEVLGHRALAVLHQRLLLEAQRELAYTTLSIKQIALGLGFAEAGYFTRFFLREAGQTPSEWREAAARKLGPPVATLLPPRGATQRTGGAGSAGVA